jgi:hypothetical protein
MSIECVTRDRAILLRVRCCEDGRIDFDELSSIADRLLHANVGNEVVIVFPDNYSPSGKQMGYIALWGNTMRLAGGTLGIVTANALFLEKLANLDVAFEIHICKSEKELTESRSDI